MPRDLTGYQAETFRARRRALLAQLPSCQLSDTPSPEPDDEQLDDDDQDQG
jgi:hypothetical protein